MIVTPTLHSLGIGIGTKNSRNELIEVFYPLVLRSPAKELCKALATAIGYNGSGNVWMELTTQQLDKLANQSAIINDERCNTLLKSLTGIKQPVIMTALSEDIAPVSVAEVYLKLHLLSHRLCKPHSLNLSGIFGLLQNIAWTNKGAIDLADLPARQLQARLQGEILEVMSVDKFPKMSNYVVPTGVRVAHTARVRLGAYLGEGTTVMHEGFVNFNAGTEGPAMIEGRISAGVMVGSGSDLGGGCSTMGTLSGGGTEIISVGKDCLIGANSGLGFPLGDRCIIEAGLYVTAGTKVLLLDKNNQVIGTRKARELSGKSDLLFRRNSVTGAVECKTNQTAIALNEELHTHN
ncbi:MAG: 2,3,4,5-tetrahydropyridine-2,6-dicarboxylate N-succinyltransferase [Gammaproteobacteria bacterium]|nr:2,3,4,5-tetrahydropyridine-2,6-dicarboxylate N-succinyltransferase [Gammaproteobacteria bacterium]MDP2349311.1 2,3,4,5-tetrahydropyridine-2,6-dicarboxylate N-succinyltransferase [Gammaproteobacteria bacterium]